MRSFSLFLLAGVAACSSPAQDSQSGPVSIEAITVSAVEDKSNARAVEWTTRPEAAQVDVRVASPRPAQNIKIIADDTTDTDLTYNAEDNARRYFTVTSTDGEEMTGALRVLPLEGGRNFRDLGGYETEDGRRVKWGLVYRSGVLANLTDTDYEFVSGLDISTIIDFRTTEERTKESTDWRADDEVDSLNWDYSMDTAQFAAVFQKPDLSADDVKGMMIAMYGSLVTERAGMYEQMFDRLIATEDPLLFHCTAGKDRTGVGAALILTALGVPREKVVADYALSEQVVDYMSELRPEEVANNPDYAFFAQLPPEVVEPLMRSDPAYIEAALDQVAAEHGSVLGFIQTELGVDDEELASLRARLLED